MIERIKQEIEQRISDNTFGAKLELIDLLSFIESLEKEQDVDLEKEMNRLVSLEYNNSPDDKWEMVIASHFYELGFNEKSDAPKIKGWVARDKSGDLYFFHYDCKPHRTDGVFYSECSEDVFHLDNSMFSEIDWQTEPIEVELTISRVKTE